MDRALRLLSIKNWQILHTTFPVPTPTVFQRNPCATRQSPALSTTPPHMVREASISALSLDGRLAAKVIRQRVKERIAALSEEQKNKPDSSDDGAGSGSTRVPGLGIVMANGYVFYLAHTYTCLCDRVRLCTLI